MACEVARGAGAVRARAQSIADFVGDCHQAQPPSLHLTLYKHFSCPLTVGHTNFMESTLIFTTRISVWATFILNPH